MIQEIILWYKMRPWRKMIRATKRCNTALQTLTAELHAAGYGKPR